MLPMSYLSIIYLIPPSHAANPGLVDYSESATSSSEPVTPTAHTPTHTPHSKHPPSDPSIDHSSSSSQKILYNDQDMLIVDCQELRPLIPGLFLGAGGRSAL